MAAYHIALVHFPIAIWLIATLAILWRAVSSGRLALTMDRALVPLLSAGLVFGLLAVGAGLNVWAWEAITTSPMGRNHMLLAIWTVAFWALVLVVRWKQGEGVWDGSGRLTMAILALLGGAFVAITGTLGGHLAGMATGLSAILEAFGWNVHRTFHVPNMTLVVLVVAAIALAAIGWLARKRGAA